MYSLHSSRRPSESALQTARTERQRSGSPPLRRPKAFVKKRRVCSKYMPRSLVEKVCLLVCRNHESTVQDSAPQSQTGSPVHRALYSRQPVLERMKAGYRYAAPKPAPKPVRPRQSFVSPELLKAALAPWGLVQGRSFQVRRSLQRVVSKRQPSHQTIHVVVPAPPCKLVKV